MTQNYINISKYLYSIGYTDGKFNSLLRSQEIQNNIDNVCKLLNKPFEYFIVKKQTISGHIYLIHPFIALYVAARLHKDYADPLIKICELYLAKEYNQINTYIIEDACLLLMFSYSKLVSILEQKNWIRLIGNTYHGMPAGLDHGYIVIEKGIIKVSDKAIELLHTV